MARTGRVRPWWLALTLLPLALPARAAAQRPVEVAGRDAWAAARAAGFEFYPVLPDGAFIRTGARDGVATALKSCPSPSAPCAVVAQVVEGRLLVLPCPAGCSQTFELFAGRRLAPGWTLAGVAVEGTGWSWARAPRTGGRDAGFAIRVEATAGAAGSAEIAAITLVGPSAEWRRAFPAR